MNRLGSSRDAGRHRGAGGDKRKHPEGSAQAPKRTTRSHTETGTLSRSSLCTRHCSPLDIYCCTDEQIICAGCATAEHAGHTIGSVGEERRRRQGALKKMQTQSKQILQKQEKLCKNMGKTLKQIQEEAEETQDYCESVLVGVIDSLQRHYMSVRELIRGHEGAAAARVETSLQNLQVKMDQMRERDAELDRLAQSDSDIQFLQTWSSLQPLCEKDLHPDQEISEDPLLPFEFTKRAVIQLGKRLEKFCDKEFASISQTADGVEQQGSGGETEADDLDQRCNAQSHGPLGVKNTVTKKVEPKIRSEFLQCADRR